MFEHVFMTLGCDGRIARTYHSGDWVIVRELRRPATGGVAVVLVCGGE